MKRMITAICLLVAAVILSITGFFTLNAKVKQITQAFDAAVAMAQEEDEAALARQTEEIEAIWDRNRQLLSALLQHTDIDDLELTIKSLNRLLERQDFEAYIDACEQCAAQLQHILKAEIPTWGNIF